MDTDVELIKPLDSFLKYDSFFGLEEAGSVATGLGFGSIKNSEIVDRLKRQYNGEKFLENNKTNLKTCIEYSAPIFENLGMTKKNETQFFNKSRIAIFATDYFCPQSLESGKTTITSNTVSIHHYDSSWKAHPQTSKFFTKYKIKMRRSIDKLFGYGTYNKIKKYVKK